jgi:hypothetical protein
MSTGLAYQSTRERLPIPPGESRHSVRGYASGKNDYLARLRKAECTGRIAIGLSVIVGVILLASAALALAIVLEVVLAVTGFVLIVNGALGYRPLYAKPAHVPATLRRSP